MGELDRREFLKRLRILPLLAAGVPIVSDSIDHDPPKPKSQEPEIITKQALTDMQALVRIEPVPYDQDRVFNFFRRKYPGSEDFVPMVFESCKNHERIYPVDPVLVLSQMLQESVFDPAAISWVGAGGLLQLMAPTAKDLGIENVYHPGYYKKALRNHDKAKGISRKADLYERMGLAEARRDARAILRKNKKQAGELSKTEKGEMRARLYKHWSGLETLGEVVDLTGEEIGDLVLESYGMLDDSLRNFQEGLMGIVSKGSFEKLEEAYRDALFKFNYLLGELYAVKEIYDTIREKNQKGSSVINWIFEAALKREEYDEIMGDVRKEYGKYRNEVREGIFVNYRPRNAYWKGRYRLKKPSERLAFDGRFHEQTNIDKGVKYDALLSRRFGGNVAYAMCAFNSGPDNVHVTVNSKTTGREIKIIQIPFIRETIRYWDNIYRNFHEWYPHLV